jgi:hypothetical protein
MQGFPVLLLAAAGGRGKGKMRGHLALSPVVSPGDGDSGKGLPPSALLLFSQNWKALGLFDNELITLPQPVEKTRNSLFSLLIDSTLLIQPARKEHILILLKALSHLSILIEVFVHLNELNRLFPEKSSLHQILNLLLF